MITYAEIDPRTVTSTWQIVEAVNAGRTAVKERWRTDNNAGDTVSCSSLTYTALPE